jgi:hypothetical protein
MSLGMVISAPDDDLVGAHLHLDEVFDTDLLHERMRQLEATGPVHDHQLVLLAVDPAPFDAGSGQRQGADVARGN